jgi:hypothetical protein
MKRSLGILVWVLLLLTAVAGAQEDVVSRALRDELDRSMAQLRLEQLEKPYFISYRVTDDEMIRAQATLGSLLSSSRSRVRVLAVTVRVGDAGLDNTHFMPGPQSLAEHLLSSATVLPLDDDYLELRRQIWLATDRAYKLALTELAAKRAALASHSRPAGLTDFSPAAPARVAEPAAPPGLDLESATRLARETSALFKDAPGTGSEVQLQQLSRLARYLNSEGSEYTVRSPRITLHISAAAEAPDGRPVSDQETVFARSAQDLPAADALAARVRDLQEALKRLQAAPLTARYEGPVLFEGEAAADLFINRFASNVVALAPLVAQQGAAPAQRGSPLLRRIGMRVLPDFLDAVNDPTLSRVPEGILLGGYKVDLEGVPAQRTLLVQQGILKTVLTSRDPVEGISVSTASLREQGVAAGNLLVTSRKSVPLEDLRRQLVQLAQAQGLQYGMAVRRMHGDAATLAYRIYPDGHEELLRNAELTDFNVGKFRGVVAVSQDSALYTRAAPDRELLPAILNFSGAEGPPLSCVVPSLLIEEVTLDRPQGEAPKPRLLPSPLAGP